MISGISPAYSNAYSGRFSSAKFGNGETVKTEEKKTVTVEETPQSTPDSSSLEALHNSPAGQQAAEQEYLLRKEMKEYEALGKYDQIWQTSLVAGSAVSALLGQTGLALAMVAYPAIRGIYSTLKRLGEWNF